MKNYYRHGGYSLIEIMITLAIVAVLTGFAIPQYQDWVKDAGIAKAKSDLSTIALQVNKYELDVNMQAKEVVRLKDLNELRGKYMQNIETLRDPWGYNYKLMPESGEVRIMELLTEVSPTEDRYKIFIEDDKPKYVYSGGPNGRDEKGRGDDVKKECRKFRYLKEVVTSSKIK